MKTYIVELASGFQFVIKAQNYKTAKTIAARNLRLSGDPDKILSVRKAY